MKIQPFIMSGGSGTRLWPLSRAARPKQFLQLATDKTMFQETALRARDDSGRFLEPVVIAGARHKDLVIEQLADIDVPSAAVILEPCPRNTAAVAAVAAAWTKEHDENALILLMPADHHITDAEGFRRAVARGAEAAREGYIVTFGIQPITAHTGYGYIEAGDAVAESVFTVAAFKEKPQRETAENYLASGGYFWNAGIFLFSAKAMIEELSVHAPDVITAAGAALKSATADAGPRLLSEEEFRKCPSVSIDYAVMEKTGKAAVVAPVDVGWTDIGSWSEVAPDGNDARVIAHNCRNTIIRSDGPTVAAIGVEDVIVIAAGDAVLVARKDNVQEVRAIVEELKKRGRTDLL